MTRWLSRLAPLLLALLAPASAEAADGPVIELAPEHREQKKPPSPPVIALGAGTAPEGELTRGLAEQRFRAALGSLGHTSVGGYGELMVNGVTSGRDAPREWTGDVRRLVLFVAHTFNEHVRAYTELELEHVKEAEIEQAYLDWKVAGDLLGLRAGLVLVPVGIINQVHEPPIFNGVVRPRVETVVIPSTWRELGIGFFGRPAEGLRYELYAMAGLDPLGLSAGGFAGARGGGALSHAKAWAAVGRLEYEPILGLVLDASGYASDAGKNGHFFLRDRTPVDLRAPVFGWSADARFRRAGLEWKVLYTEWYLPQAAALMHTFDADGKPLFADAAQPVPTRMRGGYVEGGYDVLRFLGVSHQLVPFGRLEFYDTQAAVPDGFKANPTYSVREYTFGASYRPIREVVVKGDYQLRNRKAGPDETQVNFGVGFMY
jgi:hypothetical protein